MTNFFLKKDFLIFRCFFTFWTQKRRDSALTVTIKGVSEVTKGKLDNTELLLQLLELNVSVHFCWRIVNNNITVLRRTAKQFVGRTVITNKHGLYITCGGLRVRYRMNYCWWKNTFEQLLYKANKWWSLSCDFHVIAYLYNVITAFLVIVPLPPLGGHGLSPQNCARPGRDPGPSSFYKVSTSSTRNRTRGRPILELSR